MLSFYDRGGVTPCYCTCVYIVCIVHIRIYTYMYMMLYIDSDIMRLSLDSTTAE